MSDHKPDGNGGHQLELAHRRQERVHKQRLDRHMLMPIIRWIGARCVIVMMVFGDGCPLSRVVMVLCGVDVREKMRRVMRGQGGCGHSRNREQQHHTDEAGRHFADTTHN